MRTLGIVPARGGSKGIPGKNLVPLLGRPLLAWTIEAARGAARLDRTLVSTDDPAIAAVARDCGADVPSLRPAELAGDDVPMLDVLQHALGALCPPDEQPEILVLLQPTSPLRRATHIDEAIALLNVSGADSVVSVVEVPHQFNPVSVMGLDGERLVPFLPGASVTRRQDKPRVFGRNGPAVLAVRASVIAAGSLYGTDVRPYFMSPQDSLDIDDPFDLELAAWLLERRRRECPVP